MWKLVCVVLLLAVPIIAKLPMEDFNQFFEAKMDEVLHISKPKAKTRGVRTYEVKEKKAEEEVHHHPYEKPDVIRDVHLTYSRYREMILVRGGTFWKGTNFPESTTGEFPMKETAVNSFYLDRNPVINADYWAFRAKKRLTRSDAEVRGWSWVVDMFLTDETRQYYSMPGSTGWAAVKRANWNAPEGIGSNLAGRWKHPVVHVSWYDAKQYCEFHGKRLPTEAEWEYAARAGAKAMSYPWGDSWERKRANVWQGSWPTNNAKGDGYAGTSPVDAYIKQNLIGFYDMVGNVWEWTVTAYIQAMVPIHLQTKMSVLKGGSFVDSVTGQINYAVRNGNRMGQSQDYSASNIGFRCAKDAPPKYQPHPDDLLIGDAARRNRSPLTEPEVEPIMIHRRKSKDEL